MKKLFYLMILCPALALCVNAQFGKLKDLGKKVKDATSKPAETAPSKNDTAQPNQASKPDSVNTSVQTKQAVSTASAENAAGIGEYFNVTLGGKNITQGGDCQVKFGDVSGSSVEMKFDEKSCDNKGGNYFYMSLQAVGANGTGTFYIPRKDSKAGHLSVKPYGKDTEIYATDASKQATVALTVTAVTREFIEGSLTGSVIGSDSGTKLPLSAKFKVEINKSLRDAKDPVVEARIAREAGMRNGNPNAKGEYLSIESGGSAISFNASCAFYSSYTERGALVVRISEKGCPYISGVKSQSLDMVVANYKGKGVYKVSSARALRSGEFALTVGNTSNDNQTFTTEVDLGGVSTVTITSASAEFVEGTFKADLVEPLSRKKQSFTGKFRFNLGSR